MFDVSTDFDDYTVFDVSTDFDDYTVFDDSVFNLFDAYTVFVDSVFNLFDAYAVGVNFKHQLNVSVLAPWKGICVINMCHSVVGFANLKYCNISGMSVQECSICWSQIVPESHFFDEVTNKILDKPFSFQVLFLENAFESHHLAFVLSQVLCRILVRC